MSEIELLSALIGDIYDASLEAARWPEVLGSIRRFVVGSAAAVYWKDASSRSGNVYYDDGGIEPYYRQLYFDKYVRIDPTTAGLFLAKVEEPMATADLMSYEEFVETRFFGEWVRPQGLVDCVNVVLDKSSTTFAVFGVFRHQRNGIADGEMIGRMRLIVPHLRRAVLIAKVIDLKTAEAATFADTLDGIVAGMFLIDVGKRIVHANAAGRLMLAEADLLRAMDGRLVAIDPEADTALSEIAVAAGAGDAAIGMKGIAVPLIANDGDRYVAHVLPLTSGARRRAGKAYTAVAAIFVHRAALETPSPPEAIARAYKLTPTELRVLLAIVEVGGAPEVAAALCVGEGTIKTHLSRLYEKTGTHRQADLVKLVAGFSSPLLG